MARNFSWTIALAPSDQQRVRATMTASDQNAWQMARFGRKLNVKVELEPALIGGIRVVVGDEVLDTSVKARLEQMKVALTA